MSDMIPQGTQNDGVSAGHDDSDVNIHALFIGILIIVSSTLVVIVAMAGMFNYLKAREEAKDVEVPAMYAKQVTPAKQPGMPLLPSLQNDRLPWDDYKVQRERQEKDAAAVNVFDDEQKVPVLPANAKMPGVPDGKTPGSPVSTNWKWETADAKYTADSTAGFYTRSVQKPVSAD